MGGLSCVPATLATLVWVHFLPIPLHALRTAIALDLPLPLRLRLPVFSLPP